MTRYALKNLFAAASLPDAETAVDALYAKYHDLDGVLSADEYSLVNTIGERAAMLLKLSAALSSRRITEKFKIGSRYSQDSVRELLVALFRGVSVEMLYAVSFDSDDRLLSVDLVSEGTVNGSSTTPRRLADVAVKNRAASIIIAHNHPGGVATPSSLDFSFTATVREVLSSVGVPLTAHYTVAGNACEKI